VQWHYQDHLLNLTTSDKQPQFDSILFSKHVKVKSNNGKILTIYGSLEGIISVDVCLIPSKTLHFPEIMFLIGSADWRRIPALPGGSEIPCRFFPLENFLSGFPYLPCALSTYGWSLPGLLKKSQSSNVTFQ